VDQAIVFSRDGSGIIKPRDTLIIRKSSPEHTIFKSINKSDTTIVLGKDGICKDHNKYAREEYSGTMLPLEDEDDGFCYVYCGENRSEGAKLNENDNYRMYYSDYIVRN